MLSSSLSSTPAHRLPRPPPALSGPAPHRAGPPRGAGRGGHAPDFERELHLIPERVLAAPLRRADSHLPCARQPTRRVGARRAAATARPHTARRRDREGCAGARRVQLVRGEGRDLSVWYGEGGGGARARGAGHGASRAWSSARSSSMSASSSSAW